MPGGSQPSLTPACGEKSASLSSVHTCTNVHIRTFRPTLMHIIRNKIQFYKNCKENCRYIQKATKWLIIWLKNSAIMRLLEASPRVSHKQHVRNHPRPGSMGPVDYTKTVRGDYTLTHEPPPSRLFSSCVPDCPLHHTNNSNDEQKLHHSVENIYSSLRWSEVTDTHETTGQLTAMLSERGSVAVNELFLGFSSQYYKVKQHVQGTLKNNKQMLRSRSTPCYSQNKGMPVSSYSLHHETNVNERI